MTHLYDLREVRKVNFPDLKSFYQSLITNLLDTAKVLAAAREFGESIIGCSDLPLNVNTRLPSRLSGP